MTEVIPAILPMSFEDIREGISLVSGVVDVVQVDVVDGHYAQNTTWPFLQGEEMKKDSLSFFPIELDLLVQDPEKYINTFLDMGPKRVIIHIESTTKHKILFDTIRQFGVEVGFALKPSTPNETLFGLIDTLGKPDVIQCMGNDRVGFHGVSLDLKVFEKVQAIKTQYPNILVSVDIGVNKKTAPKLVEVGVDELVSGSMIFKSNSIFDTIKMLQNL